jgi:hypothetical protein
LVAVSLVIVEAIFDHLRRRPRSLRSGRLAGRPPTKNVGHSARFDQTVPLQSEIPRALIKPSGTPR